ncbi:winged helix-turn-helix domain-containing protein [Streptomyces sp. NPDC060194]|uniref:winged helix-turn-helix domain-containing protein n=1 Tax=Streptomyces sp. NPDC060194 TaxID=3347069 RepID=UPI0036599476
MANTRSVSALPARTEPRTGTPPRPRLRAVHPDEAAEFAQLAEFLPPGTTWLPAPEHTVPATAGRPPMVGYLVLVPAVEPQAPGAVADGPVQVDTERRTAAVDGRPLDLTYLEFELLAHLVQHPHRVHTRDQLVTTVWGYGHVGDGRTVDVHVARLRRKLGATRRGSIQTVRRVGYKYTP